MKMLSKTATLFGLFLICALPAAAQRPQDARRDRPQGVTGRDRSARTAQQLTALPPEEPLTNLEEVEARTGAVVIKNYTIIGSVSGFGGTIGVTCYEFVDVQSGRKEYGIGVEIEENERGERASERGVAERIYVDYDELDSLAKGIDYIIKIDRSATLENFEAQYRTRGDLTVTTFNRATGSLRAAVASDLSGRTRVGLTLGSLADFRKLIVDAKNTLDKIK